MISDDNFYPINNVSGRILMTILDKLRPTMTTDYYLHIKIMSNNDILRLVLVAKIHFYKIYKKIVLDCSRSNCE